MVIWIANDHAGVELKNEIIKAWTFTNRLINLGTETTDSVDYPDFAQKLILARAERDETHGLAVDAGQKIRWTEPFGILICGSGQGMAIKANRDSRVRAALCWDEEVARLARAHNDANVLVLAARVTAPFLAIEMIQSFFNSPFEGGRHGRRVLKLS